MRRSDYCGALREEHIGREMTMMGWVQRKRDMGGVIFLDLRDREGILQVVCNAEFLSAQDFSRVESLRNETVVAVSGRIALRDEETVNPGIETGTVELRAETLEVLSDAQTLPFPIEDDTQVREELRLKYRFLDIRRPSLLKNLQFRHRIVRLIREYLDGRDFLEVETPILTKSTPEGARDYLVPSRVHPGTFYALPQSPQIFKQLLMVGGVDKYYQIARCFRDEDLRADRQPEFTQLDLEMSFIEQEDILVLLEGLFKHLFSGALGMELAEDFPRLTWQQAMDTYGSDKPDLRFGFEIVDLSDLAKGCGFSVFKKAMDMGGVVRAINAKGCGNFSRGTIDELTKKAISYGAKGMAWIALRDDGEPYSILNKYFTQEEMDALLRRMDARPGDFILFCADSWATVCRTLGALRLDLGDMLNLRSKEDYQFLIVTDFPQFEYSEEAGRYLAMHHPFTMPYPEDIPYLRSDPSRVRAQAYDFVLNGIELGSGSIRIHKREIQQAMFEALGFSKEEIEARFGFMVNAFRYGTPPHGGFAFGLDRLAMLMVGAESIRDVIAFPKARDASCLMTDAPNVVDEEQLSLLHISTDMGEGAEGEGAGKAKKRPAIDVEHVAELAKLSLSPGEKKAMQQELEAIVAFADQLSGVDTAGVPVTAHVVPVDNVLREDVVLSSMPRETLLDCAPQSEDGFYFVPRVVK